MNDNPKDPYAAPMPALPPERHNDNGLNCLRCGSQMFQAQIKPDRSGGMLREYVLTFQPTDKNWLDGRESEVVPMVCPNCGYSELYAIDPTQLLPKRPR